jgi:hypothetical protein
MSKTTRKIAGHAQAEQLQALTAQGVQRALDARSRELSAEQVQTVSGGALLAAYDDTNWCGTVVKFPFPRPGVLTTGGIKILINGQYPNLTPVAIGAVSNGF